MPDVEHYSDRWSELAGERELLLERFLEIASTGELWDFQVALADAIKASEPTAIADRRSAEKLHVRRLRLLGDALAWRYLHPYTIRQLAKNEGPPPSIYNQQGFAATMAMAQEVCSSGLPALVADLTNCLRISDVVVCGDPEAPLLLESGGHPRFRDKGRKGRQARRARGVAKLLRDGEAVLEGHSMPTTTITVAEEKAHSFEALELAARAAADHGVGFQQVSSSDVIVVLQNDASDDQSFRAKFPDEAIAAIDAMEMPSFGVHLRLLERPDERHAPPHVWPIGKDLCKLVAEGDLVAIHWIDVAAFARDSGNELARIAKIRTKGTTVLGFSVEVAGGEMEISPFFLDDVLYGFETVESARRHIVALSVAAVSSVGGNARIATAETDEEIAKLLRSSEGQPDDLISLPLELFASVQSEAARMREPRNADTRIDGNDPPGDSAG
jgi:hypothetical protein